MRFVAAVVTSFGSLLIACGSSRAPEPATSSSPSTARPDAGDDGVVVGACRLPAPVVSEDPCSTDADCAPKTPCHAHACVAKAHAAPRPANLACTMMMDCASIDANACACFQGRCALVPKPGG